MEVTVIIEVIITVTTNNVIIINALFRDRVVIVNRIIKVIIMAIILIL